MAPERRGFGESERNQQTGRSGHVPQDHLLDVSDALIQNALLVPLRTQHRHPLPDHRPVPAAVRLHGEGDTRCNV